MSRSTVTVEAPVATVIGGHEHPVVFIEGTEYRPENRAIAWAFCHDCDRKIMLGYDSIDSFEADFFTK